jgi:hypothetical protein
MVPKVVFPVIALLISCRFILTGQQTATPTVLTTAQADAGRHMKTVAGNAIPTVCSDARVKKASFHLLHPCRLPI